MKPTVLIIEDNEQNMYMLAYLLTSKGFKVSKAFNGKDGIELAKKNQPNLILMDIQLPDMDGYQICSTLRNNNSLPKSSVIIAVTSYAMSGDREKALESGANGYIEKPINPETFIQQMEDIYYE